MSREATRRTSVEAHDPEDGVSKIIEIVKNRLPKRFGFDPIKDVQVLCSMNRGGLGARSLNVDLQKALKRKGCYSNDGGTLVQFP